MQDRRVINKVLEEAYRSGDKQMLNFIDPSSEMITTKCFHLACEYGDVNIIYDIINKDKRFDSSRFGVAYVSMFSSVCELLITFASKEQIRENNHAVLKTACQKSIERFITFAVEQGKNMSGLKIKANYANALVVCGSVYKKLVRDIILKGEYSDLELREIDLN